MDKVDLKQMADALVFVGRTLLGFAEELKSLSPEQSESKLISVEKLENLSPAQSEPRWIPVKKRMPKPNKKDKDGIQRYYLIQNEFGDMMVAAYHGDNSGDTWWEQMYAYEPITDKVIAWMPLPRPYKRSDNV